MPSTDKAFGFVLENRFTDSPKTNRRFVHWSSALSNTLAITDGRYYYAQSFGLGHYFNVLCLSTRKIND